MANEETRTSQKGNDLLVKARLYIRIDRGRPRLYSARWGRMVTLQQSEAVLETGAPIRALLTTVDDESLTAAWSGDDGHTLGSI